MVSGREAEAGGVAGVFDVLFIFIICCKYKLQLFCVYYCLYMQSDVVKWPDLYNKFTATTKSDYTNAYRDDFNGTDDPFRYPIVVLFRLLVLLNTTISATTITYYVSIFAGYMLTSDFVPGFVIGDHIIFAGVGPDETKRIIGKLTPFCSELRRIFRTKIDAGLVDVGDGVLQQNIQLFVTVCSNYFRVAYDSQDTSFKDSLLALQSIFEQTHQSVPVVSRRLVGQTKTPLPKGTVVKHMKGTVKSTIRKPDPKLFDGKFQPKLDARVKHYIDLLEHIEWNESNLFPLLCELYWETASDPQLNQRKLLIINVFNTSLKRFEMSVRGAMNHIFYTLSNSAVKDGEQIMSLLFLKFILYFATFILNKEPSEKSLCESLSHLIGLVGSTDGENILNGGTGIIDDFLKNTRPPTIELEVIIGQIHKIFTERSIAVPDTISIQTIIPEICRIKIQQLCPGGVTDSEDDEPSPSKPACPYRYKCNRRRDAKDGDKYHFDKFSHPPGFKHIEDRPRPHWRPGGGSGKSKRTRHRPSTKRTKRRRPSTKRSKRRHLSSKRR
jgi:hypothetical protein